MNRKLTGRQLWALSVLPALAIGIIYMLGFYRPQQAGLAEASRQLAELKNDITTASQVRTKTAELASKQRQIVAEGRELTEPEARPAAFCACSDGADEAGALAQVSRILLGRSIVVVEAVRLSDGEAEAAMPADLRETAKRLGASAKCGGRGVWRLELIGSFVDVQRALADLAAVRSAAVKRSPSDALTGTLQTNALAGPAVPADPEPLVVPVGISMEPSVDGQAGHRWKLFVWM